MQCGRQQKLKQQRKWRESRSKKCELKRTNIRILVDTASSTAAEVKQRLEELKSRIDAEGTRSVAAADIKIAALSKQFDELQSTVTALAADSERNRGIMREAKSRIAVAREQAKTSEAEFSGNADINVQLVPFDTEFSRKLADVMSTALANKGFKVSRAPWSDSTDRTPRKIRISYQPLARGKAGSIADTINGVFAQRGLELPVKSEEKPLPISNDPDVHVAIFSED
jgi:hypothetical protein